MARTKQNIISSVSKRTGSSEEETYKIITGLAGILKEEANNELTADIPGIGTITVTIKRSGRQKKTAGSYRTPKTGKLHRNVEDNPQITGNVLNQKNILQLSASSRQRIIDQLKTAKKSNEVLERFSEICSIPSRILAEKIFEISSKTLYSYRHSAKELPVRITEQILKIEELYRKGTELFGSSEKFNNWLKSESYGLGSTKPLDLLNSITGIDLVYEELVRIEFGATA